MPYSSSIQIVNDANGAAYAFLADNGAVWQCQWDAEAQVWNKGALVPLAIGGEKLDALYLNDLWPAGSSGSFSAGSSPGIVLAYRTGEGAGAEIYASFGRWGSDGVLTWSEPQQLTDNQVNEQAFSLVAGKKGGFELVVQTQETGRSSTALQERISNSQPEQLETELAAAASSQRPDSDLYVNQYSFGQTGTLDRPSWSLNGSTPTGKAVPLSWAPDQAGTAASPGELTGNTQLSRQALFPTARTSTPGMEATAPGATLSSSSTTPSSSPAAGSRSWDGTAGQYNTKRGGTLRYGALVGQDPMRWQLNWPAVVAIGSTGDFEGIRDSELARGPLGGELRETNAGVGQLLAPRGADVVEAIAETGSESTGTEDELGLENPFPNPFKTIERTRDNFGNTNQPEVSYVLKGIFGLGNLGQGGPIAASKSKIGIEYGNNERRSIISAGSPHVSVWKTGKSIGIGGALQTRYQYANYDPAHLTAISTFESISLDLELTALKRTEAGGSLLLSGAFDAGYSWEQTAEAEAGAYLPAWLGYAGYIGGIAGDLEKKLLAGYKLYERFGVVTKGTAWLDPNYQDHQTFNMGLKRTQDTDNGGRNFLNISNAVIGSAMAALGPAAALAVETSGDGLGDTDFENTRGEEAFARFTVRRLWKSLIGLQLTVADQVSTSFADIKGTWKDSFYANGGVALPMGGSIPLVFYTKTWASPNAHTSESETQLGNAEGDTGATASARGFYQGAPSGSQYPFAYTPAFGSNSYLAGIATNGDISSTPLGINHETETLKYFALEAYSGPINYTNPKGSTYVQPVASGNPVTLYNAGSNLTNGSYEKVPLLGITVDGSQNSGAFASFTVENGSIVASSLKIITPNGNENPGQYLHLMQTTPDSGIYALMPDVFSTGIAVPPDPTATNQGNIFRSFPLITIEENTVAVNGSPLSAQAISRVQTVDVEPASQPANVSYPRYDALNQTTTAPPADNNAPYTYSNIQVELIATASGSISSSTPVKLLNPGLVTATVHLSGGVIQHVELDQALLFIPLESTEQDQYAISLNFPNAILETLPAGTSAVFNVNPEQATFNNFVADDQFSSQAGATNAGVYIAEGISDQIPLTGSMGRWPVQNRVSYYSSEQGTVYLNGSQKTTLPNGSTFVQQPYITPSELYPKYLYNEAEIQFSAASSPTAATIVGPADSTYEGATFVAWVEAGETVIPLTTGDGEENFQSFMDAFYGSQQINYRLNTGGNWEAPTLIYQPEQPVVIRNLKAVPVANSVAPGGKATLLVWTETSIAAIKGAVAEIGSGDSIQSVIKAGWINPAATSNEWTTLITDIQTIPWNPNSEVGLSIEDLTIASLPTVQADGSRGESTVVSWSQDVRTPYRQSVLDDNPLLYLQFGELQSGYNAINIGSVNDPATTATQASSTGLNFAIAGALTKSPASAVQNIDGTGVLSTGLGSMYAPILNIINNIPKSTEDPAAEAIARFSGKIVDKKLTVTSITAGRLAVGEVISGAGIKAGTTITKIESVDADGLGSYELNQSQLLDDLDARALKAIPVESEMPLSSFSGGIEGNTLTVNAMDKGVLQIGNQLIGEGIKPGTFITAIESFDPDQGTGVYTINESQTLPQSALVAVPGVPTTPYTIEFWAKLQPDSNNSGAGLVAFGQPSSTAVGAATLPDGWLLSSSFVVDLVTYEQAAAQGLIDAIPSGEEASDLYGWAWGLVADGANTTAMNGTGGSNLYRNALRINNLVSGASLAGMNQFLANYQLTSSDLIGIDNTNAATIAAVPVTQLQFANALDSTGQPVSNLNTIAIDTSSALLNQGLMRASELTSNPNGSKLTNMFKALWDFQLKTGEAKVNLSLAPESNNSTTSPSGQLPNPLTSEQYVGYELEFALQNGPAISVNDVGQLVFDFGNNNFITADEDLRDGNWHYIAATYLPTYQTYSTAGIIGQRPTNVGTASLYVDNQLAASQNNVINAYAPINLNDQALLLANNAGGAIDQLAFYDKALTPSQFTPNESGEWPLPTTEDALALLAAAGYQIDTKTPDPGVIPGAVSSHWESRNVNPDDALLGTYFSTYTLKDGGSWTEASNLNPSLAQQPTIPSASRPGSLQDALVLSVPASSWTQQDWVVSNNVTTTISNSFGPAGQELKSIAVALTDSNGNTNNIPLTPKQVLLGSNTLQSLQPLASDEDYNYIVPTSLPAFNLVIDKKDLALGKDYNATYTFTFESVDASSNTNRIVTSKVTNATPAAINIVGNAFSSTSSVAGIQKSFTSAIATATVIEQAPLQLKYIDSGATLKSASSAATANSPSSYSPANSFGQSQVYGSFEDTTTGVNSGWLAIAQPLSANAISNPAGRVWINFTGNFTVDSNGKQQAVSNDPGMAPNTWLDALAQSNFSPDSPNLPLLGDATYPSSSGGLLIQADPTVGWRNSFGQTMLAADVNGDGVQDLVIAAPHANEGGRVYIISGEWIHAQLTTAEGGAILDLANPENLGDYVTVLKPGVVDSIRDKITVAGFGSSLAYDTQTGTLWIGAPNYLKQLELDPTKASINSLQPIGALYGYNQVNVPTDWDPEQPLELVNPILGSGGTTITLNASNTPVTSYWGSQLGTAISTNSNGAIAVSAPGYYAAMLYSGTAEIGKKVTIGSNQNSTDYGDGALIGLQLPDSNHSVTIANGTRDPKFLNIVSQDISSTSNYAKEESAYMQNLKKLQTDNIANASQFYNKALQADSVGAVYYFSSSEDLQAIARSLTSRINAEVVAEASAGGMTIYGPNSWNVLGSSGFGSSLAFSDFNNSNSGSTLAIGASQTGGSGAVYLFDTAQEFTSSKESQPDWLQNINVFGSNQYLAHLASTTTLYGAASLDSFGSGLVNLGDVNADGYEDLLIQAFNAANSAGNGYVFFGSDQFFPATATSASNPATGSVAPGSIGRFTRADGSLFTSAILTELGSGSSAYTGQGSFGAGDVNSDGLNDIPLGSGNYGSSYLTWGHRYLEAITNLQLDKLASNTGYMLDGLATTTQGSLRSIGDFNGDGYGDFISINPGNALTAVRIELGGNTQEILADYAYDNYTFTVANGTEVVPGGDINGDGMADIVLFIDQNLLSSSADGDQGAGSTTGILYGRNSGDLPLGSGFGFIAPVDPSTSAPVAPLPGVLLEGSDGEQGLTDATPSVIAVGNTLYAAVKGANDSTIWFTQSGDGGNIWQSWTELSSNNPEFISNTGPSLAYYNQKLYLSFLNPSGTLSLSSWDPTSNDPTDWSAPYAISSSSDPNAGFQSSSSPQLIDRGDALGVVWAEQTMTPTPLSPWATLDGGAADAAMPALAELGGTLYMATQATNNSILWTSSTNNGASWDDWQSVPGVTSVAPPSLAVMNNTLYISFIEAAGGFDQIYLTSLSNSEDNIWATPYFVQQAAAYASLITETVDGAEQLAVYYVSAPGFGGANAGSIAKVYSQNPEAADSWSTENFTLIENQFSSGPLAATSYQGKTYLAYQAGIPYNSGGSIYLTTSSSSSTSNDSSGWSAQLVANVEPGTRTGVGLTSGVNDLTLGYGDDSSPNELQLKQFVLQAGQLVETDSYSESLPAGLSNNVALLNLNAPGALELLLAGTNTTNSTNAVQTTTIEVEFPDLLYASYSTTPDSDGATNSWSSPSLLLQRIDNNGSTTFQPITTSTAPSLAWLGPIAVAAVNNNGTVNIYASSTTGLTWDLVSSFSAQDGNSGIISDPELVTTDTGLALTYTNADSSINLYRLDVLQANGEPLPGVLINQDGSINIQQADLVWEGVNLTADNSGISTSLGSVPVSVEGNLLLANVRNSSSPDDQIWINAIPNLSDPDRTTWLNSTIQLSDGNGGWNISQQFNSSSEQSGSSLTPVGDLNNDGFADLLVTANNVVAVTDAGQQLATGLRFISGAANSSTITSQNDSTSSKQAVHLAAPFSQASDTPVSAITGLGPADNRVSSGALSLGISARNGSNQQSISATITPEALTRKSSSASEASKLLGSLSPTDNTLVNTTGWGEQALNSSGSYGDLNADGYLDYFDPAGNLFISAIQGLSFSLWSIRAAGDVNGNGVDDVLLSLAPQGPAYEELTSGQPSALMSVLVDGSLFKVDRTTNSFRLDQLEVPLDPYSRAELYDVASTSTSDYLPSLQNWFVPILSFTPGSLTAASTGTATNPASAESYTAPAVAINAAGQTYLVYSGHDTSTSGAELWMAYQQADGSMTQTKLSVGSDAVALSPSAIFYEDKLTIAYTDVDGDLHIAWCDGNPLASSSTWKSYQVETSNAGGTTTDESSEWNPTLVAEAGRLALYFPSNAEQTTSQTIRYLYSTDPFNAGSSSNSNGNWGSALNSTGSGYSGVSGTISVSVSGSSTQPGVTSPIAATTYQGRTVLAFRGSDSKLGEASIQLLTQVASAASASDPNTALSWVLTDTGESNSNGVGLTTDQSLLYLTSTTFPNESYDNPAPQIWSLAPSSDTLGQWSLGNQESVAGPGFAASFYAGYNPLSGGNDDKYAIKRPTVLNPFLRNGQLMAAWSGGTGSNIGNSFNIQLADLATTIGAPSQQSLAGYSLDGNIDVNGDGFTDILISDPSDPTKSVNNQYILFGGDYLDIASQVGTPGDDDLIGTPLADVIYTISGSDRVASNGGADVIYTGSGNDQISIPGNAFIRLDAGSGFDVLKLEGLVNQAYDFRLNISTPEYFAGTKLRDIELISSINYGGNTLSFDAAAVNAINPDRVLFLNTDTEDKVHLSSDFRRNQSFDTSYQGTLWSAYAAAPAETSPATSNPALIYVANTATNIVEIETHLDSSVEQFLSTAAPIKLDDSQSEPTIPIPSGFSGPAQPFGDGLLLQAYQAVQGAREVRFTISRSTAINRQVVSYSTTPQNSTTQPGLHYDAVVGVLVFEENDLTKTIAVPIQSDAFERGGSVSLQVQEHTDMGQQEINLVVAGDPSSASDSSGDSSTFSGFTFKPTDDTGSTFELNFRTDTTDTSPVSTAAALLTASTFADDNDTSPTPTDSSQLTVYRRSSSDAALSDPGTIEVEINTTDNGTEGFDLDATDNQQVSLSFQIDTEPGHYAVYRTTSDGNEVPITDLGRIAAKHTPTPAPTPEPTPPQPTPQPTPEPSPEPQPVQPLPPVSADGTVDYSTINSGLADFSLIPDELYALINWAEVDFTAIAASPGSAASLDYGLINYTEVSSTADFAALATTIQYDEITGPNLAAIAANPFSQGSFHVVIGDKGESISERGSELNDLFRVRSNGKLIASGGGGKDFYFSNTKKFEMVIKDLDTEDYIKLSQFNNRDVRKQRLQLFQDGRDAIVSYKGDTLITLRNIDADDLSFFQGNLFLQPNPDPSLL